MRLFFIQRPKELFEIFDCSTTHKRYLDILQKKYRKLKFYHFVLKHRLKIKHFL